VATNTHVNQKLAGNGSTSGEPWASNWETVSATLYGGQDPKIEYKFSGICTQIQGQIKLSINVMNEATKEVSQLYN
jgi:hypothetical protein